MQLVKLILIGTLLLVGIGWLAQPAHTAPLEPDEEIVINRYFSSSVIEKKEKGSLPVTSTSTSIVTSTSEGQEEFKVHLLPAISASQTECVNPPLVETTLPWPYDIHLAVSQGLCQRPDDVLPGEYQNLIATALDLFEADTWAFITVVNRPDPMPASYESLLDFDSILILANKTSEGWQVTFQGTSEFKQLVQDAPPTVISEQSRPYFLEETISPAGLPASPGLKWPWQSGQTWNYSQGPHSTSGEALDFAPPSTIPETDRKVLAAASTPATGIVAAKCDDNIQSGLRLNYVSGYSIGYLHLDVNSVPNIGSAISQGAYLGYTYNGSYKGTLPSACQGISGLKYWDTCGCGTGAHLHFYARLNNQPASMVGTVVSGWTLGSDGCFRKSGAPTYCPGASITSDNFRDSTPPTTTASPSGTLGENNWYRSNVQVTLDAEDNSGGTGVDFIRYTINGVTQPDASDPVTFIVQNEGVHAVTYQAVDKAGNTESEKQIAFNIDKSAPTGSLAVNNNASVTHATLVYLNAATSDGLSGVSQMRIRNAGGTWTAWLPYSARYLWQLSGPTGQTFTVEIQFKDRAGNVSSIYQDSIPLNIYPARPASSGYRLAKSTLGVSGGPSSSAGYRLRGTLGQPSAVSVMTGGSYISAWGYWTAYSLVGDTNVYLPIIIK